jgi:hypothetical protein
MTAVHRSVPFGVPFHFPVRQRGERRAVIDPTDAIRIIVHRFSFIVQTFYEPS